VNELARPQPTAALQARRIAVARGDDPADLVIAGGQLVNVFSGEIYPADLAVADGYIAGIGTYRGRERIDATGLYIAPGFIDAHIHIESTMLVPGEFARIVVPLGTTAVVADPHEIANVLGLPGIGGSSLSLSPLGMFIAFCYIWLPYMIVPIQTALERVPNSLLEASGDLGARPSQTFRRVILPLAFPGVVAGSIFTFSLTLGDFIVPQSLGTSRFFIGQAVYSHQGTSGNIPLAAAFTMGPVVIMIVYLLIARRLGAFDAL
jgi:ABC-type proline/glycine betaine transport system permease subunit